MIKFIIDKIHLRNVRNYGDEGIEMDFPVGNLTVFTGHVGAGKSTILKSISMALYGDDGGVKGEKLTIDDMVNERAGKNLEIDLYFHSLNTLDNTEDQYEIHLYHKHSKYQNKLVFMKNGVDISANGKMDTYRLIEKTIIPKEVYHNIYYFTQQAKNFFTALPNSEQKAIFDSILDLSDYDKYYENCRIQITTYEKLVSDCELQIKMIESGIAEKQSMIEKEKSNIENSVSENNRLVVDLKIKLDETKKQLDQLKKDLILDKTSAEIDKDIAELKSSLKIELNNIDNQITQIKREISEVSDKVKSEFEIAKSKAKEELQPKVDELNGKISEFQVKKTELQSQLQSRLSQIDSEIQIKSNEIESTQMAKLNQLSIDHNSIISSIAQLKFEADKQILELKTEAMNKKSELEAKVKDIQSEQQNLHSNELRNLESETRFRDIITKNLQQINSDTPYCDKCGQPLVNLDHLKKENSEAEKQADEFKNAAAECKKKVVELQIQIDSYCKELKTVIEEFKKSANIKIEEFSKSKSELETKAAAIKSEKDSISDNIRAAKTQLQESYGLKKQSAESEIQSKINVVEEAIKKANLDIQTAKQNAEQELLKIKQQLLSDSSEKVTKLNEQVVNLENSKRERYNTVSNKVSELKTQKLDADLNQMKVENLEKNIQELEAQIKVRMEFKPSEDTLKSLAESIKHDEESLKAQQKHHDENARVLEILNFWKSAFSDSGIKSMLIDVAIPHMNQCVREELDRVCPGTFTVSFDTLSTTKSGNIRDKFSINITHNLKCATGHKKLSGGEKRIIDFCCMAALRSLAEKLYGKMFCHILYDEVLDSLDSDSRELFCRSMKTQSDDQRHVLLVTHALTEDVDPDRVFPF